MAASVMMSTDQLIENVCEKCPATCWGKKAHCQVHDRHVGAIESCPEWDKFLQERKTQESKRGGKPRFMIAEAGMTPDLIQRAEEEIRDYAYMQIEVGRIQRYLQEAGEGMVARYGMDMAMPTGRGRAADKTHAEVAKRERKWKRLQALLAKIRRIDEAVESVGDEQERLIIEALLDGDTHTKIAKEIDVSRQRYYEIKRSAVGKVAWMMYGGGGDNS